MVKKREFEWFSSNMKRSSKDKYLLIFSSAEIEGVHGITLVSYDLLEQLQSVIKAVKCWCGDNNINKIRPLKYYCELIKRVNEKDNEHENQTRKSRIGLVKV